MRLTHFALSLALISVPAVSFAHGYAGKRFFPATMAVEDPFVADEAGLLFSHDQDDENTRTNGLNLEYAKTITPNLALSIGTDYLRVHPEDEPRQNGFGNTELGAKYLLYKSDEHEALLSIGAELELGGTGDSDVGAESETMFSPVVFFGKGLGDLPDSVKYLRPIAITGSIAAELNASDDYQSEAVKTGLAVTYDFGYLQSFVKDVGLREPFNHLIGIIEIPLSTCTSGECSGQMTGTINPGLIWHGQSFQLGLEATIPVNDASGNHTGVMAQVHFYLDDIFPHSLGQPIFNR